MKELRQIASVMLSMCLSCFVGFAQTEGSDDTVVDDEVVAKDVDVVVNNGNSVTPKPAFTFVYTGASALDADGSALTKDWLREKVSIKVNDVEIDFVVGPLTNGADTNIDTLSFITMDNYYLPWGAKVEVTMPALSFSDVRFNDIASKTYTFDVEEYIIIDDATDKPDFKQTKSVVIESGITYEVAKEDKMLCKTLVLEGGATLKNNGEVSVMDTAFYHCIENSYFDQAGLINLGKYSAASSVFVKYASNIVKGKESLRQVGNMIESRIKLKDMTIYPFKFYCTAQCDISGDFAYGLASWTPGDKEKYLESKYGYFNLCFHVNSFSENGYYRFKGAVRDDDIVGMSNLVAKNIGVKFPNPYPAMLDINMMVSDPMNTTSMGAKQLLEFGQMSIINRPFFYNTNTGITTYDGEMWKGYLLPASCSAINHMYKEYTYNIKKEHLTDMQTAKTKYEGQEIEYPYVRFYCDYVDKDKAYGKGYRAVFAVYFVDEDTYQNKVFATRSVKWQIADIYESRDMAVDVTVPELIHYPMFGIFRQQGQDAHRSFIKIGAEKRPDVGSNTIVNIGVARELAANTAENDEDYKVKIGILDHNLDKYNIRFKCDELRLSFDNPHVTWSGKGETKENCYGEETLIEYFDGNVDRKLFEFVFYAEENPSDIPDIDEEDITAVDEVDVACTIKVENNKVIVNGVSEGAVATLTSLSGVTLDKKDVKNGVVSFEISNKGIYFVAVEQGNATKVFKLLIK